MKVLVVGGGAREHTLVWKLSQSPRVSDIYAAPGNAGTARIARNIGASPSDIDRLAEIARQEKIGLVIVGPEMPLAGGIVDRFQAIGIPTFGPTKAAARLEASKVFAKELMQKYGIPCARSASFTSYTEAEKYVRGQEAPLVIKADGLAAGKGVIIAETIPQAIDALSMLMKDRALGDAGERVIVEEHLAGREMSSFAFTDGKSIVPMMAACDYKRAFDNNEGPNTGGMGSYSPPPFYSTALAGQVKEAVMEPVMKAMAQENSPYKGVLYGGLMIKDDALKVLEFNARFGDPETQVTLPLLETDLADIALAVIEEKLGNITVKWGRDACVGVVMASGGYPGSYKTGLPITGLDDVDKDIMVFHAGTKPGDKPGEVLTSGGRVLTVAATGKTIAEAREKVYNNISRIQFEGCHYRKDIAQIKEG